MLREQEAGCEGCRPVPPAQGSSDATFYNWKASSTAVDVVGGEAGVKSLEDENVRLKKLLAEQDAWCGGAARVSCQKKAGPTAVKPAQTAQTA